MNLLQRKTVFAALLMGSLCCNSWGQEPSTSATSNPYTGRQERADIYEFARKPEVLKKDNGYVIRFTAKAACDATVAIMDKGGKTVRHLASGVLGKNAPWPFKQNSLAQSIPWDGKDDSGKPVPPGCRVKVGLGLMPKLDHFLGWSPDRMPLKEIGGLAPGPNGQLLVLTGGREGSCMPASSPHVYVLDRRCRYQRTILPSPATVSGDKAQLIQWARTAGGKNVPQRRISWGSRIVVQSITLTSRRKAAATSWRLKMAMKPRDAP